MRLPFLAVGAALPSPPPPPDTGPVVGLSEQGQESVASPLAPGIFALSTQDQQSFATPLNPVVLGVSEQDSVSTAVYSVTGLSEQDQISFGRPLATAIFALSEQSQESTATPEAGSTTYANGYAAQFEIRLRPTAPGAVTVDNFLLPFAETIPQFRTVANGGLSQNNGLDIRFETPAGVKLGHVRADYNATTGRFAALVAVTSRNFAAEQSIFVYVGKASANEADAALARAGGWLAWYFGNSTTDQTGQSRTLTNNGVGSFALGAWPGGGFDGTADYYNGNAAATWANGLAAITYVSFHKADRLDQKSEVFNVAGANAELSLHFNDTTDNRLTAVARFGTSTLQYQSANQRQTTEPQAVATAWQAGVATRMVIDGTLDIPASPSGVPAGTTTVTDTLEWGRGGRGDLIYWDGTLSFLGFCNRALRTAEMEQMTAAFKDPRLVYGVSSVNLATSVNRAPVALRVDATATNGVSTIINVAGAGYDPNGDALSVTAATVVSGTATVTLSGTSSINLTPSGADAQSVVVEFTLSDGKGGTSVGRCYVEAARGAATDVLFLKPFNMLSAQHRPIGNGVKYGIPDAVESLGGAAVAGIEFTGTNTEARGRLATVQNFILQIDHRSVKCMMKPVVGGANMVTKNIEDNEGTVSHLMPSNSVEIFPPNDAGGERQVLLYPVNGLSTDQAVLWNQFSYLDNTANRRQVYPLGGMDANEPDSAGEPGTSASLIRWPFGLLRGHEINDANPGPIGHSFTTTVTRQTRPAAEHILGRTRCWPAYGVDNAVIIRGTGGNPDRYNLEDNNGDIPYGCCVTFIPDDYFDTIVPALAGNARGLRVVEAIYYYGMYVMDGGGEVSRIAIRCDQNVGFRVRATALPNGEYPRQAISGVREQIEDALAIARPFLYPVFNSDTYARTRQLVRGFPFVGGGTLTGVRNALAPAMSRNTAYDAPGVGYPT